MPNQPEQPENTYNRHIVIYDGICTFCNGAVNFIIARDPTGKFAFSPMQSHYAQNLITKHGIHNVGVDTFLLIKNGQCHIWTDAAFEIASDLTGYWRWFTLLRSVPRPIRDGLYRLFARNRYALFGRTKQCIVPTPEIRARFIGLDAEENQRGTINRFE